MPFVLGKALKAICKWAAALPNLEELNQLIDDKVLEDVVMALIKYPNIVDIAYYSICCLASLSRVPRKSSIVFHIRELFIVSESPHFFEHKLIPKKGKFIAVRVIGGELTGFANRS